MDANRVRESVATSYAEALKKKEQTEAACCASSCCGGTQTVESADTYSEQDRTRFAEAAATSFGCGNPLAFTGVETGQTVVDLGSGAGLDLLIAAEKVGPTGTVIGVDMTAEMIERARENARKAGFDNIDVRSGLIEELPVESETVDWVISNCVINLSPEKDRVFGEIARVLRSGGRFSISDIVAEGLPPVIQKNAAAYSACIAGAISETDYIAGLRAAGLTDVEVTDRHPYSASELLGLVADDLAALGLDETAARALATQLDGKVQSVRFAGRKA